MSQGTSFFFNSQDGLKLHARLFGDSHSSRMSVLCLPGLARTAADFDELALHLSEHRLRPRHVVAVDYRGRGLSARDPDPANYDVRVEAQDVLDLMAALGIAHALFVGTSRGGLITMALGALRPAVIRGVVLNDIGPVFEGKGLARIKSYVGKMPKPASWAEAVAILKRVASKQFTRLTEAEWEGFARRTFVETPHGLEPAYDPALMKSLDAFDIEKPLPVIWHLYEGLSGVPLLSLRGENSDLLSEATQAEMLRRHPRAEGVVIVGEGHAPLLSDRPTMQKIAAFAAAVEDGRSIGNRPSPVATT
ncbi:MAG: alpha/beta fold hydrolase [Beijerinckiaceae bacterium]